jgi:hypothetical protein
VTQENKKINILKIKKAPANNIIKDHAVKIGAAKS